MNQHFFIILLGFVFLGGCASQVPVSIESKPGPDLSYRQIKSDLSTYEGSYVRWGGRIISIENKQDSTWVEILYSPLDKFGEPSPEDDYQGRFIARIDGFIDAEHYSKGRHLTVP